MKQLKYIVTMCCAAVAIVMCPIVLQAQSDQHYTMFMYNKLQYNPGYTGSREAFSVNALYRKQWAAIPGAPRIVGVSCDAPLGNFMRFWRPAAIGVSLVSESTGIERNNIARIYYAYRIKLAHSVISSGLSATANWYSAMYSKLAPMQPGDPNFSTNIDGVLLPNFGTGVYWSGDNFYCGLSVPNMLQNYYDKNQKVKNARQIRTFYLNGGYVIGVNETIKLQPQLLTRLAVLGERKLPVNADINLSMIAYDRLLLGMTVRTDGSLEGIVHFQVTHDFNFGYAYDYSFTALNGYSGNTHEIMLGFDLKRDVVRYQNPRFIKKF